MHPPCRIEMLGSLRVTLGDRTITRFQTQKTAALLAYLAMHPGRTFVRENVAELLWPDGDPTAVRNRLNQAVSSLRRQLHPPGSAPNSVLVADHLTLAINERTVETDVSSFVECLKEADESEGEAKVGWLRKAVDAYQGELLEGCNEEWAAIERMTLAERYYDALTQLIRAYATSSRVSDAIEIAHRRLAQDPTEERSHRALMRLFVMAGRPRSALAQFAELTRALQQEDLQPSERALKLRDEALAAAATDPDSDTDPSSEEPQLAIEAMPTRQHHWLPKYLTTFFGREAEVARILSSLDSGARLVTLIGLGGVGKTRLAVEVGWRLAEREDGRVIYVSLDDVPTAAALFDEIARLLGASILDPLPSGGPRTLILDNLEHLVGPELGRLTEALRMNPELRVIATSRASPMLDGEVMISVQPLPLASEGTLEELGANPAIALFVDRAQSARQDFQLTERTSSAIVSLCRRLEGWPLALELAASWARVMTPSQMDDRVSTHFDELASRRRDIHPRHRSIRAAIMGSYTALPTELQAAFLRLAVFEGGWDSAAAAQVLPGVDLHAVLCQLTESSLIQMDEMGDQGRYRMLDTVRAFAHDLTSPDLLAEVRARHAEHYRQVVARSIRRGPLGVMAIKRDRANVLAAFAYWVEIGENAVTMACDLGAYWEVAARVREGTELIEKVLEIAEEAEPSDRGLLLTRYGRLLWLRGDFAEAEAAQRRAITLFQEADDVERLLEANVYLAQEVHRQTHFDSAIELLQQNIDLARSVGDRWMEARSLLAQGNAWVELDLFERAEACYDQCLVIGRGLDEATLVGSAMANLGNLMMVSGRLESATTWLSGAVELFERAGLRGYWIDTLITSSRLDLALGRPRECLDKLRKALQMGVESVQMVSGALLSAAYAFAALDRYPHAARLLGQVQTIWEGVHGGIYGVEARSFEEQQGALRAKLKEPQFEEQLGIGRRMTLRQATDLVLDS